jgi:hypothetical protein
LPNDRSATPEHDGQSGAHAGSQDAAAATRGVRPGETHGHVVQSLARTLSCCCCCCCCCSLPWIVVFGSGVRPSSISRVDMMWCDERRWRGDFFATHFSATSSQSSGRSTKSRGFAHCSTSPWVTNVAIDHTCMHTLQPRSSSCGRERERERGSCACIIWFHMHLLCALCAGTAFCQAVVFQSLALYFRSPYTLPLPVLQQSMGLHGGTDGSA